MDGTALAMIAREGDAAAFMRLVESHQGRVRALAFALVGDHQRAEDVAQEAFLRAWRGLRGFRGDAAFSTWLYTIARRVALEQARRPRLVTVPLEAALPVADQRAADPALRHDLRRALAGLDADQREALVLVAVVGLSYQEAAEVIEVPPGTVASRVYRARARLAEALAEEPAG